MHDVRQYQKVCAGWVSRYLASEPQERRMDTCKELLELSQTDGDPFFQRIVTVDESTTHYFQPETKRASKEWRHSNSPNPTNFLPNVLLGKLMLTLFWDSKGPSLERYMNKGTTITISSYCDLLVNHLKPAIPSNCHELLTTSVLLLHDSFRPHTANATAAKIQGPQL